MSRRCAPLSRPEVGFSGWDARPVNAGSGPGGVVVHLDEGEETRHEAIVREVRTCSTTWGIPAGGGGDYRRLLGKESMR